MKAKRAVMMGSCAILLLAGCMAPSQRGIDQMTVDEALDHYYKPYSFSSPENNARVRSDLRKHVVSTCPVAQGWSERDKAYVMNGQIVIGMTPRMVRYAWGNPDRTYRTTKASGSQEQWAYGWSRHVYFDDGIVTTIQN